MAKVSVPTLAASTECLTWTENSKLLQPNRMPELNPEQLARQQIDLQTADSADHMDNSKLLNHLLPSIRG